MSDTLEKERKAADLERQQDERTVSDFRIQLMNALEDGDGESMMEELRKPGKGAVKLDIKDIAKERTRNEEQDTEEEDMQPMAVMLPTVDTFHKVNKPGLWSRLLKLFIRERQDDNRRRPG